ncbi:anti-sigma factor domain-containing protein [Neobacillus sp. DY30]|uniref:anti-sigma factor domain-containing protein n=1 Tax=Neobacillus sp. DY30 TaxID=3047871 RepID=UPI0024BFB23E|nr:anti-sigma factor domain-containing protein [Neobacillus sp. DY30]WHY02178.1 anti-sigma factor domain-containing protein [Neobacillus sp. DY30]
MEVNDPYLTLLTSNGEFLRARKMERDYSIGEEIDFFPVTDYLEKTKSFKNFFTFKTVWMTMAVIIISLGSIIPVYQDNKAYAYMAIVAGTDIEMGLNKDMQVVELKAYDKEAEKFISQLEGWRKMDVSELTSIILNELKDDGQITEAKPVVISTVKTDGLKAIGTTNLKKNIKEIQQTVDKNYIEVNMYSSTEEEVEKAQSSGVPVGVYHRNKNKSAQKTKVKSQQTKMDKVEPAVITPPDSSSAVLPPGQQKKQEIDNNNTNNKQQQGELNQDIKQGDLNQDIQQGNGQQTPPGLNEDGNGKGKQNQVNHKEKIKPDMQEANSQKQQEKNDKK